MCLLYSNIVNKQFCRNHINVKEKVSVSESLRDCPEIMADDTMFIRSTSLSALTTWHLISLWYCTLEWKTNKQTKNISLVRLLGSIS